MLSAKSFFPLFLIFWIIPLSGCGMVGSDNFLGADPVTGGVDASTSILADIPLPNGLQRYPEHGFINMGSNSNRQGLEILRGPVNSISAATQLFNTLKSLGWQLLAAQRKKSRAFYLYSKDSEYLAITFHAQGSLTVANIWRADRLPEGAELPHSSAPEENQTSILPEEYGPLQEGETSSPAPIIEKWGGNLEEKEI